VASHEHVADEVVSERSAIPGQGELAYLTLKTWAT